jgi:hypothetical protein
MDDMIDQIENANELVRIFNERWIEAVNDNTSLRLEIFKLKKEMNNVNEELDRTVQSLGRSGTNDAPPLQIEG